MSRFALRHMKPGKSILNVHRKRIGMPQSKRSKINDSFSRLSTSGNGQALVKRRDGTFCQLLVAPLVLAVIGLGLQEYVKQHDQKLADDKAQQDKRFADDKAKQDTLVKYFDQMADSLKEGLLQAKPGSDKFIIAQSRTVIALQSLDKKRQQLIIQFLQAAALNKVGDQTKPDSNGNTQLKVGDRVLLYQAQMEGANLANNDLSGAVLIGAHL